MHSTNSKTFECFKSRHHLINNMWMRHLLGHNRLNKNTLGVIPEHFITNQNNIDVTVLHVGLLRHVCDRIPDLCTQWVTNLLQMFITACSWVMILIIKLSGTKTTPFFVLHAQYYHHEPFSFNVIIHRLFCSSCYE